MAIDGDIKFSTFPGSCQVERSKDLTLVNALHYLVEGSGNVSTGTKVTGKHSHQPFSVTCGIDKAAPKVWEYLCAGKKIKEIVVRLFHNNVEGVEVNYMTFTLQNASVAGCEFIQPHNLMNNAAEMNTESMVKYSFNFEGIVVTYDDGSGAVEASDRLRPVPVRSRGRAR